MMLGNLSLKQIEDRCGIEIPEPLKSKLLTCQQERVNVPIEKGNWHCFGIPFTLVCGDKDLFEEIKNTLLPMADKFKEPLGLSHC